MRFEDAAADGRIAQIPVIAGRRVERLKFDPKHAFSFGHGTDRLRRERSFTNNVAANDPAGTV